MATGKSIQVQFGERLIEAFAEFARADLKSVPDLEADEFSHVSDGTLRRRLAEVYYGVRWIYKLGLALLTHNEERAAHVRAQLVDYGSVVEGLLSHCICYAISKGLQQGDAYNWSDPDKKKRPIRWNRAPPENAVNRQTFWWLIRVSNEFGIVGAALEADLQWLREQRNSVHLRDKSALGKTAFLNQSKRAFAVLSKTIRATKQWKAANP